MPAQPSDVHLPDAVHRCLITGALDTVVHLDDGGCAVAGIETGEPRDGHLPLHARQLHAYAYALEHPAPGTPALGPVTRLGLLVFEPDRFAREAGGSGALIGRLRWIEIPRDDGALFGFLAEVWQCWSGRSHPAGHRCAIGVSTATPAAAPVSEPRIAQNRPPGRPVTASGGWQRRCTVKSTVRHSNERNW